MHSPDRLWIWRLILPSIFSSAGTSPRADPAAQLEMEENIEMKSSGRPGVRSWVVRGTGGTRDGIGCPEDVELAAYLIAIGPDPGRGS